jgi:rhodanese-related sulfurtransferase
VVNRPKRVPPAVLGALALAAGYGLVSELGGAGDWPRLEPAALAASLRGEEPPVVLDVRTPQEFAGGHIPGARNLYYRDLSPHLEGLAAYRDRPLVVYCETGARSRAAIRILREAGFTRVFQLDGDMTAWRRGGLPQERPSAPARPAPGA